MSVDLEEGGAPEAQPAGGSLRDRIAAQERQIEREPEQAIILPLQWLEGVAVQYRALSQREMFAIETRLEKHKDEYERSLFAVADKLINACERIVEQTGPDEYQDTGYKWGKKAAEELFSRNLPEGARGRQGVLAVFPDEEILFDHYAEYEKQRKEIRTRVSSRLEGESEASSAQT